MTGTRLIRVEHRASEVAGVIGRAFSDHPLYHYVAPRAVERASEVTCAYNAKMVARTGLSYGWVDENDRLVGVALLQPPRVVPSTLDWIRIGFLRYPFQLSLAAFMRISKYGDLLTRLSNEQQKVGDFWYLDTLGVDTELQGKGIGGQLLGAALEEAVDADLPVTLVTHGEDNIRFYERHGFSVTKPANVKNGPQGVYMVRAARSD